MSSTRAPTLSEAIRTHVDGALAEVHTMIPAVVTEYDAATQRVSVQPLVKRFVTLPDDSTDVRSYPVQSNLPVQFMSGGGFMLTCPISDGVTPLGELGTIPATLGCIVVSEASLDVWKTGQGQEVDPVFNERLQLKDAVFVPGLRPFGNPLSNVPTDHMFAGNMANMIGVHLRKAIAYLGDGDLVASKKIALDGDEADAGVLTAVAAVIVGVPTVTVTYVDPFGVPSAPLVMTPVVATPGTYTFTLKAKVNATSTQSKAR